MKKILWVCVMLYTFLPIRGQEKTSQSEAGRSAPKKADSSTRPISPCEPVIVSVVKENASKDEDQQLKANPKAYLSELIAPNNLPNLLLVAVGVGAIVYASKTVKATKDAAEASRDAARAANDSIRLQEVSLRPWVDVINWKTEYIPSTGSGLAFLKVQADVVNPTGFPLTIKGGYIKFGGNTTYYFMDEFFMTPKNPHTVDLSLFLPVEQDQMYLQRGVWFAVRGELPHVGVLGKLQQQPICGHLNCIHGQPARWVPEMPEKRASQSQPPTAN